MNEKLGGRVEIGKLSGKEAAFSMLNGIPGGPGLALII